MKTTRRDLTDTRSGMIVAVRDVRRDTRSNRMWECLCDCGDTCLVPAARLVAQSIYSCGCKHKPGQGRPVEHGRIKSPTYNSWRSMQQRVMSPNHRCYKDYGGRGIAICDQWRTFRGFLADMGDRPPNTALDRRDVNGNYEPGNCRWATAKEQANNRRA